MSRPWPAPGATPAGAPRWHGGGSPASGGQGKRPRPPERTCSKGSGSPPLSARGIKYRFQLLGLGLGLGLYSQFCTLNPKIIRWLSGHLTLHNDSNNLETSSSLGMNLCGCLQYQRMGSDPGWPAPHHKSNVMNVILFECTVDEPMALFPVPPWASEGDNNHHQWYYW